MSRINLGHVVGVEGSAVYYSRMSWSEFDDYIDKSFIRVPDGHSLKLRDLILDPSGHVFQIIDIEQLRVKVTYLFSIKGATGPQGPAGTWEGIVDSELSTTSTNPVENRAIGELVPSQASAQNQLADKNFVNSSIGTNTANYISNAGQPFTSLAQLQAYSGTVTNNDYAFVTGTDSAGNTYFDRYKATVNGSSVTWAKEYRLNNSSFTAAQWAAINSGITALLVQSFNAHLSATDNPHNVTASQVGAIKTDGSNGTSTGVSALINKLSTGTDTPVDNDYFISQHVNGGSTTTTYLRRSMSKLWNYIKNKIYSQSATSRDADAIFDFGVYSGVFTNVPKKDEADYGYGTLFVMEYKNSQNRSYPTQIYMCTGDYTNDMKNTFYYRTCNNGVYNSWQSFNPSLLENKVDKVTGKGLSTNDYTTTEKTKLAGIETGANKTTVDSSVSSTSTNPLQNKVIKSALDGKEPTITTLPISKGGTGATTQRNLNKNIVGDFSSGTDDVTDGTHIVTSYASDNGFAQSGYENIPYKRTASKFWNYIKKKLHTHFGSSTDANTLFELGCHSGLFINTPKQYGTLFVMEYKSVSTNKYFTTQIFIPAGDYTDGTQNNLYFRSCKNDVYNSWQTVSPSSLATVATSGSYNDLTNKPTIPAAQVNSDWNATSGKAQILNKPTIPQSGSYETFNPDITVSTSGVTITYKVGYRLTQYDIAGYKHITEYIYFRVGTALAKRTIDLYFPTTLFTNNTILINYDVSRYFYTYASEYALFEVEATAFNGNLLSEYTGVAINNNSERTDYDSLYFSHVREVLVPLGN